MASLFRLIFRRATNAIDKRIKLLCLLFKNIFQMIKQFRMTKSLLDQQITQPADGSFLRLNLFLKCIAFFKYLTMFGLGNPSTLLCKLDERFIKIGDCFLPTLRILSGFVFRWGHTVTATETDSPEHL